MSKKDDFAKAFKKAVDDTDPLGGHTGFYSSVDGQPIHILGDENMSDETLNAIQEVARAAIRMLDKKEAQQAADPEPVPKHTLADLWAFLDSIVYKSGVMGHGQAVHVLGLEPDGKSRPYALCGTGENSTFTRHGRSVGTVTGQPVTCKRCLKQLTQRPEIAAKLNK